MDPNFKRLYYVRYADDFVVGMASSFEEANHVKNNIAEFLKETLELTLNPKKTLISHIEKDGFVFLGTRIYRKRVNDRAGKPTIRNKRNIRTRITSELQLDAPIDKLVDKLKQNKFLRSKKGLVVPTSYNGILALDHADILAYYNYKIRGLLSYYSFAENYSRLRKIIWLLEASCGLTLKKKYKMSSLRKVYREFGRGFAVKSNEPNTSKDTLKLIIPKAMGKKILYRTNNRKETIDDILNKS